MVEVGVVVDEVGRLCHLLLQSELVLLLACSGWQGQSIGHCCSGHFLRVFCVLLRVFDWKRRDHGFLKGMGFISFVHM